MIQPLSPSDQRSARPGHHLGISHQNLPTHSITSYSIEKCCIEANGQTEVAWSDFRALFAQLEPHLSVGAQRDRAGPPGPGTVPERKSGERRRLVRSRRCRQGWHEDVARSQMCCFALALPWLLERVWGDSAGSFASRQLLQRSVCLEISRS